MMQYRMLGKTGLRVSEIGFGCGNVGGLMVRGSHDQQISSVRHALDLGINYFDTARAYGEGQSETNLGRVLDEIGEEVILSTKIRLESDALQDIAAATASEVEQGLARLGRGSVDLIQLHTRLVEKREPGRFAMTPDEVLGPGGVIEAFKRLRDQGRVGFFGFTGLGDVEAIHAFIPPCAQKCARTDRSTINKGMELLVPGHRLVTRTPICAPISSMVLNIVLNRNPGLL